MSKKPSRAKNPTIGQLASRVRTFCEARDWDQFHSPKELAIGLATEAGELLQHFRFKSDAQVASLMADARRRGEIEAELADVLFFLLRFSQMHGVNLKQALDTKLEINARKYPIEKARGSNLKYTER